jgi:hypothetical protein
MRRPQSWLGDWRRSRPRRRRRDSVDDVLLDGLQLSGEVARHPVLADSELVNAPRHLVLADREASHHPVDVLPHGIDIQRHRGELLLIGRRESWRDHLLDRTAVELPTQGYRDTNEKCDQVTGKGDRAYLVESVESVKFDDQRPVLERFIFEAIRACRRRCEGPPAGRQVCDKFRLRRARRLTQRHLSS